MSNEHHFHDLSYLQVAKLDDNQGGAQHVTRQISYPGHLSLLGAMET